MLKDFYNIKNNYSLISGKLQFVAIFPCQKKEKICFHLYLIDDMQGKFNKLKLVLLEENGP